MQANSTNVCNETVIFGSQISSRSIFELCAVALYFVTPLAVTSFMRNAISRGTTILNRNI